MSTIAAQYVIHTLVIAQSRGIWTHFIERGPTPSAFCWGSGSGHTYCYLLVCWEWMQYT